MEVRQLPTLDRSRHAARTKGSNKWGARFYQDGFYFDAEGRCIPEMGYVKPVLPNQPRPMPPQQPHPTTIVGRPEDAPPGADAAPATQPPQAPQPQPVQPQQPMHAPPAQPMPQLPPNPSQVDKSPQPQPIEVVPDPEGEQAPPDPVPVDPAAAGAQETAPAPDAQPQPQPQPAAPAQPQQPAAAPTPQEQAALASPAQQGDINLQAWAQGNERHAWPKVQAAVKSATDVHPQNKDQAIEALTKKGVIVNPLEVGEE